MIELPEAHTLAKQLEDAYQGKTVDYVEAGKIPHGFAFFYGDPALYPDMLVGRTIERAYPCGGQVEMAAGDIRLSFNDGVNIRYLAPGTAEPKRHQLYIRFEDGSALSCTVQMYGGMQVFPTGALRGNYYYTVSREKPSPYEPAFSEEYFQSIVRETKQTLSVKALLATEQRIPGLGNGCLQDILFRARLNPQTKLHRLSDGDYTRLYECVTRTLLEMRDGGGRDTEKDLYGAPGGYRSTLSKATYAYPCPSCGGGIERKAFLGGNVYFCPICQPVLK
ncbi:endonuclease VIII [Oscillospiraceae bacterium OttesenSCG-928-G22]|nr:endonuclease VIII [Oscillospiraceae bacterium OttesenSCG-928-G22]